MKKIFNLLFYTIVIIKVGDATNNQVPVKRLCGDEKCIKPIAQGKTLRNYSPDTPNKISFEGSKDYTLFSKPENEDKNSLYEISVSGKRGFAPKNFLQEIKVIIKKEDLIPVDIEKYKQESVKIPEVQGSISEKYDKVSPTSPLGKEPKSVNTEYNNTSYNVQELLETNKVVINGTPIPNEYSQNDEEYDEIIDTHPPEETEEAVDSTRNDAAGETISRETNSKLTNFTQIADSSVDLNASVSTASEIISSEGNSNVTTNVNQTNEKLNSAQNELDVNNTVSGSNITQNEVHPQKNLNETKHEEKDVKTGENPSGNENNIKVDSVKKDSLNDNEISKSNVERGNNYSETEHVKPDSNIPPSTSANRLEQTPTKENQTEIIDSKEKNVNVLEMKKEDQAKNVTEESKLIGTATKPNQGGDNGTETTSSIPGNSAESNTNKNGAEIFDMKDKDKSLTEERKQTGTVTQANPGANIDTKIEASASGNSSESNSAKENRTEMVDLNEKNENVSAVKKEAKSVTDESKPTGTVTQSNPGANSDIKTESSNSEISEASNSTNQNGTETLDLKKLNGNSLEMNKEDIANSVSVTEKVKLSNDLNRKQEETVPEQSRTFDENNNMYNNDETISDVSVTEDKAPEENKSDERNIKGERHLTKGIETITEKESTDEVEPENIEDKSMAETVASEDYGLESDHFTPAPRAEPVTSILQQDSKGPEINIQDNNMETGTTPQSIVEKPQNVDSSAEIFSNLKEDKKEELLELQNSDPKREQPKIDDSKTHKAESDEHLLKDIHSVENGDEDGMLSMMFNIVNNFWSTPPKDSQENNDNFEEYLNSVLHAKDKVKSNELHEALPDEFCEKIGPNECPSTIKKHSQPSSSLAISRDSAEMCTSEKDFFSSLSDRVLEMVDLLACLLVTAVTILVFVFGYYCICSSRKENTLLSKLNVVERSLLVSSKESAILKHELDETKNKLASIENNSFGTNDMVIALKKDLEDSEQLRIKLQDQITSLEKELETAAEAGLELNKIVSELLSNQSGDDSIIHTVEDLQKQLNEQQNTIFEINTTLAEKSRENSELQLLLNSHTTRFQDDMRNLEKQNQEIKNEKDLLQAKINETERAKEQQLSIVAEKHHAEISSLNREMAALRTNINEQQRKLQQSESRVQVLEECLISIKNNKKFNIKDIIDAVNVKSEAIALSKERDSLRERLEAEMDARKLLEEHVKSIGGEVSKFKQEYNEAEKQKVEAQTRLEVLSNYFKEKETQLQKELSLKEAMWLKQQGEASGTVERVRQMQDEIQSLKSQNDSLRAEIEAQAATHKAQITNLENRAHETWLAARQSERKLEEARSEGIALRRKLTTLAVNPNSSDISQTRLQNSVDGLQTDLNNAPSPVHMDSPNSPLMGGLPPHLPFLPHPPFMAPPHPFMPIPPPFMPPGEMRPPPLGRLMSPPPPPPPDRYSPSLVDERNRYSPENDRYTPDSRFNYNTDIMSYYDTETDFSPPPSPGPRSGGGNSGNYNNRERDRDRDRNRGYKNYSPPPRQNNSDRSKKSKGVLSSESADSFDSRKSQGKGKV